MAALLAITAWISPGLILTAIAWALSRWLGRVAAPEIRSGGMHPSKSGAAVTRTIQQVIAHDERAGS